MTQQDDYLVDAILCHKELTEQGEALALAQDTIRIALHAVGYEQDYIARRSREVTGCR